jgi:hypothetical protein
MRFFEKSGTPTPGRKKLLLLSGVRGATAPLEQKFFWFFFFKKRTAFHK